MAAAAAEKKQSAKEASQAVRMFGNETDWDRLYNLAMVRN